MSPEKSVNSEVSTIKSDDLSSELRIPQFNETLRTSRSQLGRFIDRGSAKFDYGFVVHPRDPLDALSCAKFLGLNLGILSPLVSGRLEGWMKRKFLYNELAKIPPFVIGDGIITSRGSEVKGALIAVLLYGEQMLPKMEDANSAKWSDFARERIIEAISLAKSRGAKLIGLGALTSPTTIGGRRIIRDPEVQGIGITSGNSFTAFENLDATVNYTKWLGLTPQNARVAIVGADGSVGGATSRLIVANGFKDVLLIGSPRHKNKLAVKLPDLKNEKAATFTHDIKKIQDYDIIINVTSGNGVGAGLEENASEGSFIIDDTQPKSISELAGKRMRKRGVTVIDGGFVYVPGLKCRFNLRTPRSTTFACLAETILLAREGRYGNYSIGDADVSKALEMGDLSRKHGFKLAEPTLCGKIIPESDLQKTIAANSMRHNNFRTTHQIPYFGHSQV